MKYFYLFIACVWCLLLSTSCEKNYRDIVFFTGEEPTTEPGINTNLTSSAVLYTIGPKTIFKGIDGGDGDYTVTHNSNEDVVYAGVEEKSNGYARLRLTQKKIGEAVITVKDGSGRRAMLKVSVSEYKQIWTVAKVGIVIKGAVSVVQKAEIEESFKNTYPVGIGGRYELYPAVWGAPMEKGRLLIYLNDAAIAPIIGEYGEKKTVNMEGKEVTGYFFAYNNKEYLYFIPSGGSLLTRDLRPVSLDLVEDVTAICPVTLPEGVSVYRVQEIKFD